MEALIGIGRTLMVKDEKNVRQMKESIDSFDQMNSVRQLTTQKDWLELTYNNPIVKPSKKPLQCT